jgi:hypothetical protein
MLETETIRLGHERMTRRLQEIIDAVGKLMVHYAPLSRTDVLQQQSMAGREILPRQLDDPFGSRESRSCESLP